MSVYILGTGLSHNGSAVLLKNGRVVVAIEKERITRKKHDGGNDYDAVKYCLDAEGITLNDLCLVVQCANFEKEEIGLSAYQGRRIFPEHYHVPVITLSHHLAHAYSASGRAPFSGGHVFVLDGCGSPYVQCDDARDAHNLAAQEMHEFPNRFYCEKDSLYRVDDTHLTPLEKDFSAMDLSAKKGPLAPETTRHSIGGFYAAASKYCFGSMDDAGKLMGLAPYGKSGAITARAFDLREGRAFVNYGVMDQFDKPAKNFGELKENFGYYADFACWVQEEVEEAILYTLRNRIQKYQVSHLCYTGGVALNALANARIKRELGLEALHIEPAAGDNGLALGCAFYGWFEVFKQGRVEHGNANSFGRLYDTDSLRNALAGKENQLQARQCENITEQVAVLLAQGNTIGWFSRGAEFGPRALGNRSILASPFTPGIRDYINAEIKLREDFRPFAPSILAEDITTYYQHDEASPFMLLVNTIKPEYETLLDAVVHKNSTSRVQTVTREDDPLYYGLLQAFKRHSGHGILLNTSFNKRGMPIVESPSDAIDFFMNSKLNYLVLNDIMISRKQTEQHGLASNH